MVNIDTNTIEPYISTLCQQPGKQAELYEGREM